MTSDQQAELVRRAIALHCYVLDLREAAGGGDIPRASLAVADVVKEAAELDKLVEACKAEATA